MSHMKRFSIEAAERVRRALSELDDEVLAVLSTTPPDFNVRAAANDVLTERAEDDFGAWWELRHRDDALLDELA